MMQQLNFEIYSFMRKKKFLLIFCLLPFLVLFSPSEAEAYKISMFSTVAPNVKTGTIKTGKTITKSFSTVLTATVSGLVTYSANLCTTKIKTYPSRGSVRISGNNVVFTAPSVPGTYTYSVYYSILTAYPYVLFRYYGFPPYYCKRAETNYSIVVTPSNSPPTLAAVAKQTVAEASTKSITLVGSDPDGNALTYVRVKGPAFMTLTGKVVKLAPTYGDAGTYTGKVKVYDGKVYSGVRRFSIIVTHTNRAPTLAAVANQTLAENSVKDITMVGADVDGQALTYSKVSGPAFMTVVGSKIHLAPGFSDAGTYTGKVKVSDGALSAVRTFSITVANVNRAPTLAVISPVSVTENITKNITMVGADADGDVLTYTKVSGPSFMSVTGSIIKLSPGYSHAGVYTSVVKVSDGLLSVNRSFTITVINVDRAPTISSIPTKFMNEGDTLSVSLIASDPDGTPVTITLQNYPYSTAAWNVFPPWATVSGKTVTLKPDFMAYQNSKNRNATWGYHLITMRVSSNGLSSLRWFWVGVKDVNRAPTLNIIPAYTVAENATKIITMVGVDPDGDAITYSKVSGPAFMTVTGNKITLKPGFADAGVYSVSVQVSDSKLVAKRTFNVTVSNVNRVPSLAVISNQSMLEANVKNITMVGSDPDGQVLSYSKVSGPAFMTVTGSLIKLAPGYVDAGVYTVSVKVTDGSLSATRSFSISVTNVNQPPSISYIANQTVSENTSKIIAIVASDPDGNPVTLSVVSPTPAFVTILGKNITIAPSFSDSGSYSIKVKAIDGVGGSTIRTFNLTVVNVDRAPVFTGTGNKFMDEGAVLDVPISFIDPDGTPVIITLQDYPYSATAPWRFLPAWATVSGKMITFKPGYLAYQNSKNVQGINGYHIITMKGTSNGLSTIKWFWVGVRDVNRLPTLAVIPAVTLAESATNIVTMVGADPDGKTVTYSKVSGPAFMTVAGNKITLKPGFADAGVYSVSVQVSDGKLVANRTFNVTVTNLNRAPSLSLISNQLMLEANVKNITMVGSDPDGQVLSYSKVSGPAFMAVNGSLIKLAPGYADAGVYTVSVKVSDGSLSVTRSFSITVTNVNQPPILSAVSNISVNEAAFANITMIGSDPDGNAITYSKVSGPAFMTVVGKVIKLAPNYTDNGFYTGKVQVSDGKLTAVRSFSITVLNTNRTPIMSVIGNITVAENSIKNITMIASDPDAQPLTYSKVSGPTFMSVVGTTIKLTPTFSHAGSYTCKVQVSDGSLKASRTFTVIVTNTNRAPAINVISSKSLLEAALLNVTVISSDPDLDPVSLSLISPTPVWVSLTGNILKLAPDYLAAGTHTVTVKGSDGKGGFATRSFSVIVTNVNRPPLLAVVPSISVGEGTVKSIILLGTDPDSQPLTYSMVSGPSFMSVVGDKIKLSPGFTNAGTYAASVKVSDGALSVSRSVSITVVNTDRPPVFTGTGNKFMNEGAVLNVPIIVTDPDGTPVVITLQDYPFSTTAPWRFLPAWATVAGKTVTLKPDFLAYQNSKNKQGINGYHLITMKGTSNGLSTIKWFWVGVRDINSPPTLTPISNVTMLESSTSFVTLVGSDPDPQTLVYSKFSGPAFVTVSGNQLKLSPTYSDSGSYTVVAQVSDGTLTAKQTFAVSVTNINQPATLSPILNASVAEGSVKSIPIVAIDLDGDPITYSLDAGAPAFAVISGSSIKATPGFNDAGVYPISVSVTDGKNVSKSLNPKAGGTVISAPSNASLQSTAQGLTYEFWINPKSFWARQNPIGKAYGGEGTITLEGNGVFSYYYGSSGGNLQPYTVIQSSVVSLNKWTHVVLTRDMVARKLTWYFNGQQVRQGAVNISPVASSNLPLTIGKNYVQALDAQLSRVKVYNRPITAAEALAHYKGVFSDNTGLVASFPLNGSTADITGNNPTATTTGTPVWGAAPVASVNSTTTFSLTVINTNRAPVLNAIANVNLAENMVKSIIMTASDPDADALTYSIVSGPVFMSISGKTIKLMPGFNDAGTYTATVKVTDGKLSATRSFTIVIANTNRPPVISAIINMNITEGLSKLVNVVASDPDNNPVTLSLVGVTPTWATISGKTITLSPPVGLLTGSFTVDVLAKDGKGGVAHRLFNILINHLPVLTPVVDKTVTEGSFLTYNISGTDLDGQTVSINKKTGPLWATVFNGVVSVSPPSGLPAGPYVISVWVDDGVGGVNTGTFNVFINHRPSIAVIGRQNVTESILKTISVSTSDSDADLVTLSLLAPTPVWVTLVGNSISMSAPAGSPIGPFIVKIQADDGRNGLFVRSFIIDVNRAPVIAAIPDKLITEGKSSFFIVTSTDLNGDLVTYSLSNSPAWVSVIKDKITLSPALGVMTGPYSVTVNANDGNGGVSSRLFNVSVNHNPILTSIPKQIAVEGLVLNVPISATDSDGNPITLSLASGASTWVSLVGNNVILAPPVNTPVGPYTVGVIASDAFGGIGNMSFTVEVNQPPVIASIIDQIVTEGSTKAISVVATDVNKDAITLLLVGATPAWATIIGKSISLSPPLATPTGPYVIDLRAKDGRGGVSNISFNVSVNHIPSLNPVPSKVITELSTLSFNLSGTDPDGDVVVINKLNGPSWATVVNGVVKLSPPASLLTGPYTVFVQIKDNLGGVGTGSFTATINHLPSISFIAKQNVTEAIPKTLVVLTSDSDGDPVVLSLIAPTPAWVTIVGNKITMAAPAGSPIGPFTVKIQADDGRSGIKNLSFLLDVNRAPVITVIPDFLTTEGTSVNKYIISTDLNGDPVTYSLLSAPSWVTLVGNRVSVIAPAGVASGPFAVSFQASDGNGGLATSSFNVSVNHKPVIANILPQVAVESRQLTVPIVVSDSDLDTVILTLTNTAPSWITLVAANIVVAPPINTPVGPYIIQINANDGRGGLSFRQVIFTVNQPPVINPIPDKLVNEGGNLGVFVSTKDSNSDLVVVSLVAPSPAWATITGQSISLSPPMGTLKGPFVVGVHGDDGRGGTADITFNVNVNQLPILTPLIDQIVTEGTILNLPLSGTDTDNDPVSIGFATGPAWVSVFNNMATIKPGIGFPSGPYVVTVDLFDGRGGANQGSFNVIVNHNPVISTISAQNITEGVLKTVNVTVSDIDTDPVTLSLLTPTPAWISVVGTVISMNAPAGTASGPFTVKLKAVDGRGGSAIRSFLVDVNRPPVVTPISNRIHTEKTTSNISIVASDLNNDPLTYTLKLAPAWVTISGNVITSAPPLNEVSGPHTINFEVSDGNGGVTPSSFTIEVNHLPIVAVLPYHFVTENVVSSVPVIMLDKDNDPLSISLGVSTPSWITVSGNNILFNAPINTPFGPYPITASVSDGRGGIVTQIFTVQVNKAPVFTPILDQSVNEGTSQNLDVLVADANLDPISLSIVGVAPSWVTLLGKTLTFNPPLATPIGPYPITLQANDGRTGITTLTFNLAVNQNPVLATIADLMVTEGLSKTIALVATDAEGSPLTFTLKNTSLSWVKVSGASLIISPPFGTPVGPHVILLNVIDNLGGIGNGSFKVTINRIPVFTAIPDQIIGVGLKVTTPILVNDPDANPLTLSLVSPTPAWVSISPGNILSMSAPVGTPVVPYIARIMANDGIGGVSYLDVSITINTSPVILQITPQTVTEDKSLDVTLTVSDINLDIPVLSLMPGSPSWATLKGNIITLKPVKPTLSGPFNISVKADDLRGGTAIMTFSIDVNHSPFIVGLVDQNVIAAVTKTFSFSISDPDGFKDKNGLSVSILRAPAWVSLSGSVITALAPLNSPPGPFPVELEVIDGRGGSSITIVNLTVVGFNTAPNFPQPVAIIIDENTVLNEVLKATDVDGDPIVFSLVGTANPAWITLAGKTLTLKPLFFDSGSHTVSVMADDGFGGKTTVDIMVIVKNVNRLPVFNNTPFVNQIVDEGTSKIFLVTATDPDKENVTFASDPKNPIWVTVTPTGSVKIAPTFSDSGTYTIIVIADDGHGVTVPEPFNLVVNNINRPPTIPVIANASMIGGSILDITVGASDPDGDILAYSLDAAAPVWASVINDVLSLTPKTIIAGTFPITVTVNDGNNGTASQTFIVNVTRGNSAPYAPVIPTILASESVNILYPLNAVDDELDPITYAVTGPAWITVTNAGVMNINPPTGSSNTYLGSIKMTDDRGLSTSNAFKIIVTLNVNTRPTVIKPADVVMQEGSTLPVTIIATDAEGDALTYKITSVIPWVTGNGGNVINLSPGYNDAGSYSVALDVIDARGALVSTSFKVLVNNTNRVPLIAQVTGIIMYPGDIVDVPFTFSDPDGDTVSVAMGVPNEPWATLLAGSTQTTGTIHIAPLATQPVGKFFVKVDVSDPTGTGTMSFPVEIKPGGNNAPVITMPSTFTAYLGSFSTVSILTSDIDGDIVNLTKKSGPAWGIMNGSTLEFSPSATIPLGNYSFVVEASDGKGGIANATIVITTAPMAKSGNTPPLFSKVQNQIAAPASLLTVIYKVSDADIENVTITKVSGPAWVTLTSVLVGDLIAGRTYDLAVKIAPSASVLAGKYAVSLEAVDASLNKTKTSFYIEVFVNKPPVISPIADVVMLNATSFIVVAKGSDPEGQVITWSLTVSPPWVSIDGNIIALSPPDPTAGLFSATLRATDSMGAFSEISWNIDVGGVGANGNHAPVIDPVSDIFMNENTALTVNIITSDVDGDPVGLILLGPKAAFITLTGNQLSLAPGFNDGGTFIANLQASDGLGGVTGRAINIIVGNVNRAPIIDPIGTVNVNEGAVKNIPLISRDPDVSDSITFSLVNAPAWVSFKADPKPSPLTALLDQTATLTLNPPKGAIGTFNMDVKVTDSAGLFSTITITIKVLKVTTGVGVSATVTRAIIGSFKVTRALQRTLDSSTPIGKDMICKPTGNEICAPGSPLINVCEYEENGECKSWVSSCSQTDVEVQCVKSNTGSVNIANELLATQSARNVNDPTNPNFGTTSPYKSNSVTTINAITTTKQCLFTGSFNGNSNFRHRVFGLNPVKYGTFVASRVHKMVLTNNSASLSIGSFNRTLYGRDGITQLGSFPAQSNGQACVPGTVPKSGTQGISHFEGFVYGSSNNRTNMARVCEQIGSPIKFHIYQVFDRPSPPATFSPTQAGFCPAGVKNFDINIATNPKTVPVTATSATYTLATFGYNTCPQIINFGYSNSCTGGASEQCTFSPMLYVNGALVSPTPLSYTANHVAMTSVDIQTEIDNALNSLLALPGYANCVADKSSATVTTSEFDALNSFGGTLTVNYTCDETVGKYRDEVVLFSDDLNPVPNSCGTIDTTLSPTPVSAPSGIIKFDPNNPLVFGCDPTIGYRSMCLTYWDGVCHDTANASYCGAENMAYACGKVDYKETGGNCPSECLVDLPALISDVAAMSFPITTSGGCKAISGVCANPNAAGCLAPEITVEVISNIPSTLATGTPTAIPTLTIKNTIDPALDPNMAPLANSLGILPGTALIKSDSSTGSTSNIGDATTPFPAHSLPPTKTIDPANSATFVEKIDGGSVNSAPFTEAIAKFAIVTAALNSVDNQGGSRNAKNNSSAQFKIQDIFSGKMDSCSQDTLFNYCFTPVPKPVIAEAKAGKCVQFPKFCSSKTLGICTTWHTDFCCYSSKMTRSLVTQFKSQLGTTWGSKNGRVCGGLKLADLDQIDWSKIDMSLLKNEVSADNGINVKDMMDKLKTGLSGQTTGLTNQFIGGNTSFKGTEMGAFKLNPADMNIAPGGKQMNQDVMIQAGGKLQGKSDSVLPASSSPTLGPIPYQDLVPQ